MTMTTQTPVESHGLGSPTGRFCTWLILGESDLALGIRARAWNLARLRWGDRRDVTLDDVMIVRAWLDQELNDVFELAAKGVNPELRAEAFRVRVGLGRPRDVDAAQVARLLVLLYHVPGQVGALSWWAHDDADH
jgi:hypothetical protein